MDNFEKTSLILFNLVVNFAHAALLYLSLTYYLHGAIVPAIISFLFLIGLVIFQCHQIVKFAEQCRYRKEVLDK